MKKLIIAVIVLSFFGFGPLQSFFQSSTGKEGEEEKSIPFLEKIKDSSVSENKVETFLITESNKGSDSSAKEPGLLLKYDKDDNKIEFGSIFVQPVSKEGELESLKKEVLKNYQEDIDYCFIIDTAGIGSVIDLLAPNGIELVPANDGHLAGEERQILKGEDFVQYYEQLKMNSNYANELSPIFMVLKEEIMGEITAEKLLTLAPQLLNETLKNVQTDIGKGKLMDLGLSVMLDPITSIEPIELVAANKNEKLENVNKMLEGEQKLY